MSILKIHIFVLKVLIFTSFIFEKIFKRTIELHTSSYSLFLNEKWKDIQKVVERCLCYRSEDQVLHLAHLECNKDFIIESLFLILMNTKWICEGFARELWEKLDSIEMIRLANLS
jgi:hypothetical protein